MTHPNQKTEIHTLQIGGMSCVNCEVAIERRLQRIDGIENVAADHINGTAELRSKGTPDIGMIRAALADEGYELQQSAPAATAQPIIQKHSQRDYVEIAAIFTVLFATYLVLRHFDLLPKQFTVLDQMSYGFIFMIGLVASVSSCMAVTGGLLVAVAARYNETFQPATPMEKLKPHLYFNAGRVLSYTLFGGLIGALGSLVALSPEVNGLLTLFASAIMILLGLQMLKLLPSGLMPRLPKALAHRIHDFAGRQANDGAFALGAFTFFLPCGFTQALQLYVLAKGSATLGALTMLAFALGTLPALMSLSALSSFAKGATQKYFLRIAGVAVVALGLLNVQYGLVLANAGTASERRASASAPQTLAASTTGASAPTQGTQILNMTAAGYDYRPHQFVVTQGQPVEWRIDGREAEGCGRMLISPGLGVRKILSASDTTIIRFTPQQSGEFAFNCGMGMMTPGSKITVTPAG